MKLSLKLHNKTYSVESDESFDGSNVYDLAEQFKGLLVNAGFHPSNVDSIFNLDHQWFTNEENEGNMQGHLDLQYQSRAYESHLQEESERQEPQEFDGENKQVGNEIVFDSLENMTRGAKDSDLTQEMAQSISKHPNHPLFGLQGEREKQLKIQNFQENMYKKEGEQK